MSAQPLQRAVLDALLRKLAERTGLAFPEHRLAAVESGARRVMVRSRVSDPAAFLSLIEQDIAVFDELIVELTIGETYFFRELAQFEFIRREILPEIHRRRGVDHAIRCWSAGCASGEEAYSLAIVLAEAGLRDRAHLVGTDISRASLARALRATYRGWSFRGEGSPLARRYFRPEGEEYVLDQAIRSKVTFEYLNLALDTYPSFGNGIWGMDLILCRNVLIYFDRESIRSVAQRLYAALADGGWLITASSDPPLGLEVPLVTVPTDVGVFYRRAAATIDSSGDGPRPWLRREPGAPSAGISPPAVVERRRTPDPFPTLPTPAASPARTTPAAPARSTARGTDWLAEARDAFARGDYGQVVALVGEGADVDSAILRVRALANLEPERGVEAAATASRRHSLCVELHYLHAALLMELDRSREAVEAMRRVLFLDRSLAIAHFALGSILQRLGDVGGARRAFRNARDLCAARPPEESLPLSDGERAGRVAEAAEAHLGMLGEAFGGTPAARTGSRGGAS